LPLHVVVVDELAFYLTLPEKAQRQEFTELLRDLVARARAAGVIVCAATQKPGADVVPSALRDLFGFRLALRCTTPQASDTILGQGWASAGADASDIPGRSAASVTCSRRAIARSGCDLVGAEHPRRDVLPAAPLDRP
jgi:S-DNA-T family DNA segregation ATPase FtsK/SpoIIIE